MVTIITDFNSTSPVSPSSSGPVPDVKIAPKAVQKWAQNDVKTDAPSRTNKLRLGKWAIASADRQIKSLEKTEKSAQKEFEAANKKLAEAQSGQQIAHLEMLINELEARQELEGGLGDDIQLLAGLKNARSAFYDVEEIGKLEGRILVETNEGIKNKLIEKQKKISDGMEKHSAGLTSSVALLKQLKISENSPSLLHVELMDLVVRNYKFSNLKTRI